MIHDFSQLIIHHIPLKIGAQCHVLFLPCCRFRWHVQWTIMMEELHLIFGHKSSASSSAQASRRCARRTDLIDGGCWRETGCWGCCCNHSYHHHHQHQHHHHRPHPQTKCCHTGLGKGNHKNKGFTVKNVSVCKMQRLHLERERYHTK